MQDYLIQFASTLDPNGNVNLSWPKYDNANRSMVSFGGTTTSPNLSVIADSYREDPISFVIDLSLSAPA